MPKFDKILLLIYLVCALLAFGCVLLDYTVATACFGGAAIGAMVTFWVRMILED